MIIRIQTTIGFDPVEEREAVRKFMADNDMSLFRQDSSTKQIMFTKTEFYGAKYKMGKNGKNSVVK